MGSGGEGVIPLRVLAVLFFVGFFVFVVGAEHFGLIVLWATPGVFEIETLPATDVGTNYVTLSGNVTELLATNATVWFYYGSCSMNCVECTGGYTYMTENMTVSLGNFSQDVIGIQLVPEQKYYFRACGNDGNETLCGNEYNFTMDSLPDIPTYNFSINYDELESSKFNVTKVALVVPKSYTMPTVGDIGEYIFYGLFFGVIFLAMWIRSEDVLIPALLAMITSATIMAFLPAVWLKLAQSLFAVAIMGVIYSLVRGRK